MSFGFSIGDLVALIALTKKTYDGWRDAPREYEDVVQTLSESNMLVSHVERRFDTLIGSETNAGKQEEIGEILRSCERTVSELRSVIERRPGTDSGWEQERAMSTIARIVLRGISTSSRPFSSRWNWSPSGKISVLFQLLWIAYPRCCQMHCLLRWGK
jgi:hypothetical protein